MKLSHAQKIRLGLFFLGGLLILLLTMLTLTGLNIFSPRDRYRIRFQESVGGLSASAPVKHWGVPVGRVEDMQVLEDGGGTVEITIAVEKDLPLYEGIRAVLDTSGITGVRTVNLTGGDPDRPRIKPGSLIPAGASFIDRITGRAEDIAIKAEMVLNQFAQWSSAANRVRAENMIDATTQLANTANAFLNTNRLPTQRALDAIGATRGEIPALSQKLQNAIDSSSASFEKTLKAIRDPLTDLEPGELRNAVIAVRDAGRHVERRFSEEEAGIAISELKNTMRTLNRTLSSVEVTVRTGQEDLTATMQSLRKAAEDMEEFGRIIAQDPGALIRGQE